MTAEESGAEAGEEVAPTPTPTPAPAPTPTPTAAPAPTPAGPSGGELSFLITSDLDGALIDASCGEVARQPALPGVAAVVAEARGRGQQPVVIDAGDALFPSPLLSHLLENEASAREVADALHRAGYDALALGNDSITVQTASMTSLLNAANAAGLPFLLSNIECGEDVDEDECEAGLAGLASEEATIERGGLRIGLVNVVPEAANSTIRTRLRAGASLTAPIEATRTRVRALRTEGVDVVVVVSNLDSRATAPRATLELLAGLEGADRPDVVIAASTAQVVGTMEGPTSGPPILNAAPGVVSAASLHRVDGRWVLTEAPTTIQLSSTDPDISTVVSGWNQQFCERFDRPLAGGRLTAELDRAAFGQLVLRSMREQTNTEIAVINRSAVADTGLFPLSGQLTAAEVHRAIPNRALLRRARIKGADLTKIAGAILDSEAAYSAGLSKNGDTIQINGRDIDPDRRYSVVTTAFVAGGGDGIIAADAAEFEPVGTGEAAEDEALADRVVQWVDTERGSGPYDPTDVLDLQRRVMWYGGLILDAGLTYASITSDPIPGRFDDDGNPVRYNQAQLTRQGVLDLRGALEINGGLNARGHNWENNLRLRYGMQHLETAVASGEYSPWAESVDQILFRSAYDMDYLRDVVLDGAWYGPSFFIEYNLESEFYHPDPTTPHFLEMTGLLGLKLKPLDWLRFSAAFGIRSMVTDPDPFPVPGLNLRAELARRRLSDAIPVFVTAFVDYFVGWPVALPDTGLVPAAGSAIHKLSAELDLEVTLYGPLNLVGMIRGFVYDENPGSPATAVDATAGLRVALGGHRQSF